MRETISSVFLARIHLASVKNLEYKMRTHVSRSFHESSFHLLAEHLFITANKYVPVCSQHFLNKRRKRRFLCVLGY